MTRLIKRTIWGPYAYLIDLQLFLLPFQELMAEIFAALNLQPDQNALDAGCGTGNVSKFIWQKMDGQVNIIGIDYVPLMLKKAQVKLKSAKAIFQQADLNKALPFTDNMFDAIFSCHVLYNLADPSFTLQEFFRILKPGGKIVIATPQTNNPAAVLPEHFKQIFRQRNWICLGKTCVFLPWLVLLAIYNLLLSAQSATSQDFFYTEKELAELLVKAKFQPMAIKSAYADVDILAVAKKEVSDGKSGED